MIETTTPFAHRTDNYYKIKYLFRRFFVYYKDNYIFFRLILITIVNLKMLFNNCKNSYEQYILLL